MDQSKLKEKKYTLEEVSKHTEKNDCWIIIENKVYDVTYFLGEHPGGDYIILSHAGKDCTGVFEDIGHSFAATKMLNQYLIGSLSDPVAVTPVIATLPATDKKQ